MGEHLEGSDSAKDVPFNKSDIVTGLSAAIADMGDSDRKDLAGAIFDICAESVWGPFPANSNHA